MPRSGRFYRVRFRSSIKRMLLASVAIAALIGAAPADDFILWPDADPDHQAPAVSGPNGKLEGSYGELGGRHGGAAGGSFAVPLGHEFGLQVDGLAGWFDGDFVGGSAAQGFWRDPDRALIGIFGSYRYDDRFGGKSSYGIGPQAELYLGPVTLRGLVGAQFGDASRGVMSAESVSWYPTDDIALTLGHQLADEGHAAALGAEMQVYAGSSFGVALFAEGRFGEQDRDAAWAGLRIYFGDEKTLLRRHREDDPPNRLLGDLYSFSEGVTGSFTPPPTVSGNAEE